MEKIKDVVEICGDLYVKSQSALESLFDELRRVGYQIDNLREADYRKKDGVSVETMEKNGWSLWFAHIDVRRGKCASCNGLIDVCGIQSHGHKCELCGAVTYYDIIDGTRVQFSFIQRNGDDSGIADITMKAKRWDTEAGYLYFYPEIFDGLWLQGERVKQYFETNKDKWEEVEEDGKKLIRVIYPQPWNRKVSAIEPSDISRHYFNHKIVRVWENKEYDDCSSDFPLSESMSIYEAWHWAPLKRSPRLHEKIIGAAGMVSRCSYYYQDGRPAFYDLYLQRMRLFVEHFTELNLDAWDRMIRRAERSGPGMIMTIARFCHDKPEVDNSPNFGNILVGLGKALDGQKLIDGEMTAMVDAIKDPRESEKFFGVFRK
ncbi:MAG: hypothetical protein Q7R84_01635 [bacterium]|nr:hypothetical protein [bacterium]